MQLSLPSNIKESLGLDTMSESEQQTFLAEMQALIFEASILRYVSAIDEDEQSVFFSWLQTHQNETSMWEKLSQKFPQFSNIFAEEVQRFVSFDASHVKVSV